MSWSSGFFSGDCGWISKGVGSLVCGGGVEANDSDGVGDGVFFDDGNVGEGERVGDWEGDEEWVWRVWFLIPAPFVLAMLVVRAVTYNGALREGRWEG